MFDTKLTNASSCIVTGVEGARQLGAALTQSPPLEVLLLDLNPIGGDGGVMLLEGAAKGGRLQVLSLDGCRLTDQCWLPLAAALTTLHYVSLAANPFTQVSFPLPGW